ncbi:MAG TPA: pyridoxamine 5'-phosphate oxidase family protein [Sphingomicrobium sp.]|jgi:general stress protein 26|nr:pyridoxamine 5'-phosphate oxidase family protein [Sphingomicrobium sp.]
MTDEREIEEKFWSELKDSPFVMLGIEGARDGATQPMTALFEDEDRERGLLWFFTAKDHDLTRAMGQSGNAMASFAAKGHGLFASLRGTLRIANEPATIDRLWGPMLAQYYEGKDDPKLALVRFDIDDAKIWLSDAEGFLKPVLNRLRGRKPEAGLDEKVAEVSL